MLGHAISVGEDRTEYLGLLQIAVINTLVVLVHKDKSKIRGR